MAPPSIRELLRRRGTNQSEQDPAQSPHQQSANADEPAGEDPKSSELRRKHIEWLEEMGELSSLLVTVESVPMSQDGYKVLRDFTEQMRSRIESIMEDIKKEIDRGFT